MQLYETFTNHSTYLKNVFVTLKHVLCDVLKDHKLYAMKNKIVQNPDKSFCRNGLNAQVDGRFHLELPVDFS
jgi:hypothetical protein